jgi:hypothetical protein
VAWRGQPGMATALAHPAGAVARPGRNHATGATVASSGRLGPWCDRCVAWEVAASQGCGAGGWRAVAADRGSADHGCNWPVSKPSTKVLNAKKNINLNVV